METDERQARLAELARRIAEVQPRIADQASQRPTVGTTADRETADRRQVPAAGGDDADVSGSGGSEPGEQRTRAQQEAAARAICLRLLSIAPRPRAGLAQALHRKEIPQDVATEVLDRFTEIGLIDDVAYAHSFVRVKHRDRALGRAALRKELRKLGVDEDTMSEAVQAVDTDAERSREA